VRTRPTSSSREWLVLVPLTLLVLADYFGLAAHERGFAHGRGCEVDEVVLILR